MITKLVHYAADAVLVSAVLAGIKRSNVRTKLHNTTTLRGSSFALRGHPVDRGFDPNCSLFLCRYHDTINPLLSLLELQGLR